MELEKTNYPRSDGQSLSVEVFEIRMKSGPNPAMAPNNQLFFYSISHKMPSILLVGTFLPLKKIAIANWHLQYETSTWPSQALYTRSIFRMSGA